MVKCSNCGFEIEDSVEFCPNCGTKVKKETELTCDSCGNILNANATFCPKCGNEVNRNTCQNCGAEIQKGAAFCPSCGNNVKSHSDTPKTCSNCGVALEPGTTFCPECGTNILTGKSSVQSSNSDVKPPNQGFIDKIDINAIIKPTLVSLIVAIILSSVGVIIGLSWLSFVIAVIISVGFFAGLLDNDANAIVSGLFVGLILGILENPLIEFWWGKYVAAAYEWLFGGQIIFLIILGIIAAYVSNTYLKSDIDKIADKHLSWLK